MFSVTIFNDKNEEVVGTLELNASPAEYYAGCVQRFVSLLKGGDTDRQHMQNIGVDTKAISTRTLIKSSLMVFFMDFHRHPAFSRDVMLNETNVNSNTLKKMYAIFQKQESFILPEDDTSLFMEFQNLIETLKIDGISSVKFSNDLTKNHEILYRCGFPEKLIPGKHLCELTGLTMDEPCRDKNVSETLFDKGKLIEHAERNNGENPYTRQPLIREDLITDMEMQDETANFVSKVKHVYEEFPDAYRSKYREFQDMITGELTIEEFKANIIIEKLTWFKEQLGKQKQDPTSADTYPNIPLFFRPPKNPDPIETYNSAVANYQNKKYAEAIAQLKQALNVFEKDKSGNHLKILKCYSTMISCHRQLKQYDEAIKCAEQVIIDSADHNKDDLTAVIKKYHECLTLRGDGLKSIYDKAIENYKAQQHHLSLYKLLFILEKYDANSPKTEIATCHSTLASCYRDLGLYNEASSHCDTALSLRKECLPEGHTLIKETEKKLEGINELKSEQKSSTPP